LIIDSQLNAYVFFTVSQSEENDMPEIYAPEMANLEHSRNDSRYYLKKVVIDVVLLALSKFDVNFSTTQFKLK
jgi:hypothetical protein